MKLQTKIIIDKIVGVPLVAVGATWCALRRALRGKRSIKNIQRIAVCKMMGMGSIIQSTPLLQTLKVNFPNAEIIFITSVSNQNLLKEIHVIDTTWLISDDGVLSLIGSMMRLVRNFFSKRIDLYLDLEVYSYFSTVLTAMSHARKKFGLYRLNDRIRSGVYDELMYYSSRAGFRSVFANEPFYSGGKEY